MASSEESVKRLQDQLLAIYTAACAPLSAESLLSDVPDMEPNDLTARLAVDELKYAQSLTATGFSVISKAFDLLPLRDLDEIEENGDTVAIPELSLTLVAASAFAKRLGSLMNNLHVLCIGAAEKSLSDPINIIKDLETKVKNGERVDDVRLKQCFDFTPHAVWNALEVPLKNKVGFKTTTAVISEGKVEEEALKVTEFRRKKQRNPTDLGLEDSDFESDGRRSRASSARAGSTDGGSTRGSLCGPFGAGALTSRSASSGAEEHDIDDIDSSDKANNPFTLEERGSSVVFSFDKEREVIDDKQADPEWDEKQRHQKRYSRIRNRVPTGHPSLMRGASDELAGIVDQFERQLSNAALDSATAENTESNKHVAYGSDDDNIKSPPSTKQGIKKGVVMAEP